MTSMFLRLRERLTQRSAHGLPPVAREVKRRHLTYLSDAKLLGLRAAVREVLRRGVDGDVVEFGVALGGSAILLATEAAGRRFRGYDVFGMIPPPGERDDEKARQRYAVIRSGRSAGIGGDAYYGYQDRLFDRVCSSLAEFGHPVDGDRVSLHRGLFADTVRFAPDDRVALAHLDCDWYDPVRLCLQRTAAVLQPGGLFVLDDYNDYGGCRRALDEFLEADARFLLVRSEPHAVVRRR